MVNPSFLIEGDQGASSFCYMDLSSQLDGKLTEGEYTDGKRIRKLFKKLITS